ncbi:MAG: YggS family pyridoxal phosphate-dependent enzyme [Candidatus Kariarchaeaceae archaeon]
MTSIAHTWISLQEELDLLCREDDRKKPTIIAVSKTRTDEEIEDAISAGITHFGENNPVEFKRKSNQFPGVNWHFIGNLQSNNVKDVVPTAASIHSIDRLKIVKRLKKFEYQSPCFIQVNISSESTKSGVPYSEEAVSILREQCHALGVRASGLMAIGHPDWTREVTLEKYKIFVAFGLRLGFTQFSIGMTGDWREAVIAGATHLRIGTAIFGQRL